jgi:nucleoside-diphosphate-sugar epimerase
MNKALITGGLGFIGYHLSCRLLADGFEVHAYDDRRRGTIDAQVEALRANSRYRLIIGDLIDAGSLERLADDYTYIFHMAAIVVGVRRVAEQPQISTGGKLPVFSANHKRTFCYVDDAVEFIVRLAKASAGLSGTFNIGSSTEEISIGRLAELIAATVGKHLEIESAPAPQGSTERRQPHLGVAITVTGYNPTVSLHEGILRTYEWYRARGFETAEP